MSEIALPAARVTSQFGLLGLSRRVFRSRVAAFGTLILLLIVAIALLAPVIAPYRPDVMHPEDRLAAPSLKYLLGADEWGRDLMSRVFYGARISLLVGFVSIGLSTVVGVALGLLAGYAGRAVDAVIMRFLDGLMAFPSIFLAISILAILGPSLSNVMIAIAVTYIPQFSRITRASVLAERERDYVLAARALGASDLRIALRSILPNCLSPIIVQVSLGVAYAILTEASLSFLGLGVQPPDPSWGSMLNTGRSYLLKAPWYGIVPGVAIFLTVLSLNLVGDGLRDALDPRMLDGDSGS